MPARAAVSSICRVRMSVALEKAKTLPVDGVILDLEDSVAP
jgi:citrate lyase beta subunit